MNDYPRLLRYLRPYLGRFTLAVICSGLVGLLMTALTSLLIPITNQLLGAGGAGGAGGKLDALRFLERYVDLDALAAWTPGAGASGRGLWLIPWALLVLFLAKG
ncbi:MAG: hypothetical protein PVF68_07625, partial [Acidobacteriota bacterium]